MMLMKTRPSSMMRPEVDRLFDRFFDWSPFAPFQEGKEMEAGTWVPFGDMSETDEAFLVRLEVPGIPRENLDVNLEGHILTISGRREETRKEERENVIWQERQMGRFVRSVRLPTDVNQEKIEAKVDDGVLTVRLPKVEPRTASKIVIK